MFNLQVNVVFSLLNFNAKDNDEAALKTPQPLNASLHSRTLLMSRLKHLHYKTHLPFYSPLPIYIFQYIV